MRDGFTPSDSPNRAKFGGFNQERVVSTLRFSAYVRQGGREGSMLWRVHGGGERVDECERRVRERERERESEKRPWILYALFLVKASQNQSRIVSSSNNNFTQFCEIP